MSPQEAPICAYEDHREYDWRFKKGSPSHPTGTRWVCGLCHPPPFPDIFEVRLMDFTTATSRITWRAGSRPKRVKRLAPDHEEGS